MLKHFMLVGCFLLAAVSFADDDVDLRINGDFRNASANPVSVPGWSTALNPNDLEKKAGSIRILPTRDPDDFAMEITAAEKSGAVSLSDFHPVVGNMLELEAKVSGSGTGTFTVYCYDKDKRLLRRLESELVAPVDSRRYKMKKQYWLAGEGKQIAFIRIGLVADAGSKVVFEDVEAEFKKGKRESIRCDASAPVGKDVEKVGGPNDNQPQSSNNREVKNEGKPGRLIVVREKALFAGRALQILDGDKFELDKIQKAAYCVELTRKGEVEFTITENRKENLIWNVVDYDSAIVKIEIEHKKGWLFSSDHAKIEIEGLTRGKTVVELSCGEKTMQIICNVR